MRIRDLLGRLVTLPPPEPSASPTPPAPASFADRYREALVAYRSTRQAPAPVTAQAQAERDAAQRRRDEDAFIAQLVAGGGVVWVGDQRGPLSAFRNAPDLSPFGRMASLDEWTQMNVENS